jgi:creatinine amidohydrolase
VSEALAQERAHDIAVRAVLGRLPEGRVSVASPLTRRWGSALSAEYKSGACHAGAYETSLVLAAGEPVRDVAWTLPDLTISLSHGIKSGKKTFVELGMADAYTGAPARASREEGDALYEKHVAMIVGEVEAGLDLIR